MPPEITPGRSLWLRLLHVIEQREDHIHQVNSLIRRLGSHGILTDQYLLGPSFASALWKLAPVN